MLKQRLQQKLLQKLSPQQIQLIKLLEVPTIQLEQRIKKELEENPVLEEGSGDEFDLDQEDESVDSSDNDDEFSFDDYIEDDEIPSYKTNARNYSKDDDKSSDIPFSIGVSFHENLKSQLGLRMLDEATEVLALYLIGNIDDDGYLRRDLENIVDDLAFSQNISTSEEELIRILELIQELDPAGVGARDLQECLLIQIRRNIDEGNESEAMLKAREIIRHHFDEFTKKHYEKIMSRVGLTESQLKASINEILKLNPKPGGVYSDPLNKTTQHIIPDFLLEDVDGELQLSLNSRNAPELHISTTYANMLARYNKDKKKTKQDKEAVNFMRQKMDSAKWFIDAIKQRQHTLILTMGSIMDYQKAYFYSGDEADLRPMILKDIAEKTGLDISTISRVANSKYIQTDFGIFPLKYFFSEGMQTESGEEVSTREIKKILKECVEAEEKKKPLTDEKLAAILKEKGYNIARRTVAKYREQLDIPVARLRKEL